jgi:diaminohydroxyphosphoribosylaminopyrimidine deaminase/5-amino-6-(5-phosphoribosylamino)uracil reductase
MNRCLVLAQKGLGATYPNPMVGAVVVVENKIIAEGWHKKAGTPHAEVHALEHITNAQARKATLYVNLEPCAHHGKTPPCCDLVIVRGIKKVVIGAVDPNPKVAGKGIHAMREAGVEVVVGIQKEACLELNKRFYWFHQNKKPYIILKWAESADGFIAPNKQEKGDIFWISDKHSQQLAHRWRAEEHAILVGRKTAEQDNPELTTRNWSGTNPIRMLIDPKNKVSKDACIKNEAAKTIVFNCMEQKRDNNISWEKVSQESLLHDIVDRAYTMGIQSIIVEGGAQTIEGFLKQNLWNECRVIIGQKKLVEGIKAPFKPDGEKTEKAIVGDYLRLIVRKNTF